MMSEHGFLEQAQAMRPTLIQRRRDFHRHPELAFEETRTAGIVAQTLNNLGLEVQGGVGKTGVVAILEGAHDGPTVLVRADMDALPIHEENHTDYVSQTPGKMHACGHDGHTAIALGVAEILTPLRDRIQGRIKFVFQPAEEIGQGAKAMVDDGVLDQPRPEVSVGLHLWNSLPTGVVGVADGPVMAGASKFSARITGRGGHAASPHMTVDPVVCAAQVISAFQTIVSRNADPFDSAVISVSAVNAGETHNVIPQYADLQGTVRFFRDEVRDLLVQRMKDVMEFVTRGMGCSGEISFDHLTVPVINDPDVSAQLRSRFDPVVGKSGLDETVRTMGAEDVGMFMSDIPGMYFFVGAQDKTAEAYYPHHHPRFSIDEDALPLGVALLSTAVAAYVLPEE
jgi:amidohydrolase